MRTKRAKEEEERKAKREGGLWIESGSGKKSKGRKTGSAGLGHPLSPVSKTAAGAPRENRLIAGGGGGGGGGGDRSPRKDKSVDVGGRAGTWGPTKILSRKENGGGSQGASGGVKK